MAFSYFVSTIALALLLPESAWALILPSDAVFTSSPSFPSPMNTTFSTVDSLSSNTSSEPVFLFAETDAEPVCNGTMLGSRLDRISCYQAIRKIGTSSDRIVLADKGHFFNVRLPQRYLSCK